MTLANRIKHLEKASPPTRPTWHLIGMTPADELEVLDTSDPAILAVWLAEHTPNREINVGQKIPFWRKR